MFYKTIRNVLESELIEKKSRFICVLLPSGNIQEAETALVTVRQQYPAARHYCYAFRLRNDGIIMEKCSDDGEPAGTAGMPMLNVLKQHELVNVIAVVVRYFGGILLGTGGLVRAYGGVVTHTISQAETIIMEYSQRLRITMDYSHYGSFQNKCMTLFKLIVDTQFTDKVMIDAWLAEQDTSKLVKLLDEITAHTAMLEYLEKDFVAST